MKKSGNEEFDIRKKKEEVSLKHIRYYDKVLSIADFIMDEYSKELIRADIDFLDIPKNALSVLDFLVSAITKIQKGQRLALGLDEEQFEDTTPQINFIEGVSAEKL